MVAELEAVVQPTQPPRVQITVTGIGEDTPLLTNGGFEDGTTGWTPGPGVTLVTGPGDSIPEDAPDPVEGTAFGYATITGATSETVLFSQQVEVPAGANISASGQFAGTPGVPAALRVTPTTGGVPEPGVTVQDSLPLADSWQELAPETLQLDATHDGVLVEVVATPLTGEIARNLMLDPAAHGADATGSWSTIDGVPVPTIDVGRGHDDLRSFHLTAGINHRIAVTVPADADVVTCSAWIYAETGTTYFLRVVGDAVSAVNSETYTGTGDWEYRTITTEVTHPGAVVQFFPVRANTTDAWVDDVGITAGDTPVDFSGDTADEGIYTYTWAGTPYASASIQAYTDPFTIDLYTDAAAAVMVGYQGTLTVYRVVGSTYTPVRGMVDLQPSTDTVVGYDQGAPFGVEVYYTMEFVRADGLVTNDTAGPLTLTSDASWLSHPITGEGLKVTIAEWTDLAYAARQNIINVSGRAAPVVVSDLRITRASTLVLYTATQADLKTLRNLLATGDVLQVRPVCDAVEPDYYIAVGDVTETRVTPVGPGAGSDWRRTVTLTVQAVDQPAPAIPALGDTLEDLHDYVPGTLADFPTTFGADATLLDIAQTPLTLDTLSAPVPAQTAARHA